MNSFTVCTEAEKSASSFCSSRPFELPQGIIDSFARFLVPEIRKYYESKQGQREFEEWLEEQKREEDNK